MLTLMSNWRKIRRRRQHPTRGPYSKTDSTTIYRYCESPKLYSLIEILWLQAGPALRYHAKVLRGIADINFHREAIAALEKRKRGAAGAAIARDIKAGMAALLAVAQFADDETTDEPISDGQEE